MYDTFFMHYYQSVEQLLDYHPRITFVPPIVMEKGLRDIPYSDILRSNVHVVSVQIGGIEFDKPLVLCRR